MTATVKRVTLGFGAGLIALTAVAGVFVQAQDQNQDPQAQAQGTEAGALAGLTGRADSVARVDRWASCRCSAAISA
jgi:hypothetical protein